MQLTIQFSALLASLFIALASQEVAALPTKRAAVITLPLYQVQRSVSDLPILVRHQQVLNRRQRRYARMTGRPIPSDVELRENIEMRMSQLSFDTRGDSSGSGGNPSNAPPVTNSTQPTAPDSLPVSVESDDVGYFAVIQIGTPPKNFSVTIDSGSADFWVQGENCEADSGGPCATVHASLGSSTSSTFIDTQQPWDITYGSGAVSGTIVSDNVSIANLVLKNHTFGVADQESDDFSSYDTPYDGLIGLALGSLSNQGVPTPVEAMAKQGLIKEAITSYKISRVADNKHDGEITFGALDPAKFDPSTLITIPNVSKDGFWEGKMDALAVNGTDSGLKDRTAIFDTGTTGALAPIGDADLVHQLIPGSKSQGQGFYTVPCLTNSTITMTFGGRTFSIDPKDLAEYPVDESNPDGDCISGISGDASGDDTPTQWLLGDTFLKNVYLSTNVGNNSVSLAIPT
jgi:hypothetical protein